jgi:LPS export ABC transporter protein LptC
MKNKHLFIIFVLTLLMIGLFSLLNPQKNTKFIIAKGPSKIEDVYLKHKDGEIIKWDLTSEVAYIEEKRNMIDLEGIIMNINQGDGISVKGRKGTVDEKEKTIVLQDSVVIEMKDYTLYTDSLTYNGNKRAVTTEDDVRLEGKDLLITGRGLYADIEKERVKVRKNVVATLY